jgi:hypothetical protein
MSGARGDAETRREEVSSMAQLTAEDLAGSAEVFGLALPHFKTLGPKAAVAAAASLAVTMELRARLEPEFLNELVDELRVSVMENLEARQKARDAKISNN